MSAAWLLLTIVCSARAPHPCHDRLLGIYPSASSCDSAVKFMAAYPQDRQIKVWCEKRFIETRSDITVPWAR